jgi:transposase
MADERCEGAVVQAPAPERPIDGGMATEALLAHVLVNKYADHLPLYRQSQIFARQGVDLDRSTFCNWVGRSCWWLEPLYELVLSTVLSSSKVVADDTTLLQVDGYAGFGGLVSGAANDAPTLAFCWAHTRRKFYDVYTATKSPFAHEALQRIGVLYAIKADIRGQTAEQRQQTRQQHSRPLVEALHAWLTELLTRLSGRSTLAQAIRYALNHWKGSVRFLDDGRFELDTNIVERAMRPVALGRKNALFAGADSGGKHWAIIATLIQTAKLNDVEPMAWLTHVLKCVVSGHTKRNQLDTLLPWNWKPQDQVEPVGSG